MRRLSWWAMVGGLVGLGGVAYTAHLDPWKDSILFQRLSDLAKNDPQLPVALLLEQETKVLSADREAEALLDDGFEYENDPAVETRRTIDQHGNVLYLNEGENTPVVSCGNWNFPGRGSARFIRDGSILRGDNYVYAVEIYVDETCHVRKADGGIGPVPFL